jgi:dihydrolipoamide dehydrogenase
MLMTHYTAAIIGSGPAGHTCAVRLAQLGAKVAVIERDYVGGICTNWGCTPSKAMIEAAKVARTVREAAQYGVDVSTFRVDFQKVAARRDEVIKRSRGLVVDLLNHHGVDIYQGEAEVSGPGRLKVRCGQLDLDGYVMKYSGEVNELDADHVVLATGSQPSIPGFVDPDDPFVVSSNRLISVGYLPSNLTIVGGGVIGLEFAGMFANLGSDVTIIEYLDRVLAMMDPDVSQEITERLSADGVKILAYHKVHSIKDGSLRVENRATGEIFEKSPKAILIAVGRQPVIEKEMFDRAGIAYDRHGIQVDEYLRTTAPGVWAVGDATGKSILAHVGMQQGLVCAENIVQAPSGPFRRMDYDVIPAVVYTIPEVVSAGIVPQDLAGVSVHKVPFSINMRARIEGFEEGFVKIWVRDERLIAVQAVGHNVSEITQELANMIALKTPLHAVADVIHAHPTYSEICRGILEYALGKPYDFYL